MSKIHEFLFEIGCEEIPARMQRDAEKALSNQFLKFFNEFGIDVESLESYITPRRQVIKGMIASSTKALLEEKRGPKENAPRAALDGFLKSLSLTESDLIKKDGYYFAHIKKEAKETKDLLRDIISLALKTMPWPKVMRYPGATLPWVRPIRSILCVFNQTPIHLTFEELGLTSSNTTKGHRFLKPIEKAVSSFNDYDTFLKDSFVILNHEDRQNKIKQDLLDFATQHNIEWIEDLGLLEEVAGLVEYPFTYIGKIEEEFMHLPSCVLTTSMRVHQKYFAFYKKGSSDLAPYFGVIANFKPEDPSIMLKGFQKVLKARLTDASFFYDIDLKTPLKDYDQKLDKIIYHNQLGTLKDKLNRLKNNTIFDMTDDLRLAIDLSKSDLLTQMVGEFAELQGKMGHIYAVQQGIKSDVALALEEYYLPEGPFDPLPSNEIGAKLSLLDKMDAVVGFLKIGLKPTGSKDPFALRRQALGIIRILLTDSFKKVDLISFIKNTLKTFSEEQNASILNDIKEFILDRFSNLMHQNMAPQVVLSVLKSQNEEIYLSSIKKRIEALDSFLNTNEGNLLKALHKRAIGVCLDVKQDITVSEDYFENEYEKSFFNALKNAEEEISTSLKLEDYQKIMLILTSLQKNIATFFERVLINVDDDKIKNNRKALLIRFLNNVKKVADLSVL
ncbi:MAG: glycine--tRNA ligase subunit beta [Proteobacteria bacterium]|nr:glycine--tRNA ligase subunit beta [Pseudomonadota bacterium]